MKLSTIPCAHIVLGEDGVKYDIYNLNYLKPHIKEYDHFQDMYDPLHYLSPEKKRAYL